MAANTVTITTPGPQGPSGLNWEAAWTTSTVYQFRDVVRESNGNLYFCTGGHTSDGDNRPSASLTYWSLFLVSSDAHQWATRAKHSIFSDQAGNQGYSANHYASKAADWAKLSGTKVTDDAGTSDVDYSSKEFAIGTSGAAGTATTGGSSKNWAQETIANSATSGVTGAAAGSFSAKVYAQAIQTGTSTYGGSSLSWAQASSQVPGAGTNDRSAKAWAQGSSMTGATLGGSAKDWAQNTTVSVDGTEYSSKEYAQGGLSGTGGSSKNWAQQTGAQITGGASTDASAKEWATGTSTHKSEGSAKGYATTNTGTQIPGTTSYSAKHYQEKSKDWAIKDDGQVTNDAGSSNLGYSAKEWATDTNANIGSAQDWASKTTAQVASTDYSSKEWATGTLTGNSDGSAKQWALGGGATFDKATAVSGTNYSAQEHAIGETVATGSAKEWASKDTTAVASGLFSAKEYASGTSATGGTAKEWAQKSDGAVDTEYSAKAYASVTGANAPTDGSAKEWATNLGSAEVATGAGYSSKTYAQDETSGTSHGGSAKGWAQTAENVQVPGAGVNDRSAKHYSEVSKDYQYLKLTSTFTIGTNELYTTPYKLDLNGQTLVNNGTLICAEIIEGTGTITGSTGSNGITQSGPVNLANASFVTPSASQTLENKTITSPVINNGVSGTAILDSDTMTGVSATKLSTSESIKAYVDAQVASEDTLAELNDTSLSSPVDSHFLVHNGSNWVNEAPATAKTSIGLGSVDNTADSAKPVSTATQTALDAKAPTASPVFTGTTTYKVGTTNFLTISCDNATNRNITITGL